MDITKLVLEFFAWRELKIRLVGSSDPCNGQHWPDITTEALKNRPPEEFEHAGMDELAVVDRQRDSDHQAIAMPPFHGWADGDVFLGLGIVGQYCGVGVCTLVR